MKKCFTYQEVKWLQGVVSLSVIYLLIEKKYIKVQYNFTDTVDQASKVNPNRQYSRSSPQLTNREGGGGGRARAKLTKILRYYRRSSP